MKSIKLVLIFALLFGLIFTSVAAAADTANVTATVTVESVSVSVSDGTVAYGTLSTSATQDTTTSGVDDSQTATNDGNITENLNIKGYDSAGWTLSATTGSENYTHKFCTSNCDSSPAWTALTTSYQTLATSVSVSGDQIFDLQVGTPTSTSNFTQQSVDVTVQAVVP